MRRGYSETCVSKKKSKDALDAVEGRARIDQFHKDVAAVINALPPHKAEIVHSMLIRRHLLDDWSDTMGMRMRSLLDLTQAERSQLIAAWAEELEHGRRRQ